MRIWSRAALAASVCGVLAAGVLFTAPPAVATSSGGSLQFTWNGMPFTYQSSPTLYPDDIFFNTSSTDGTPMGDATIDFGDGTSGPADPEGDPRLNPNITSHSYPHAGNYVATLTDPVGPGSPIVRTADVTVGDAIGLIPEPERSYDSRTHGIDSIPAHGVVTLPLGSTWAGQTVDATRINVTVTDTKQSGYVTVYPDGSRRPNTSTVNFAAGQTVANHTDASSGTDGKVAFYNGSNGPIDLIVDWYGDDVPTTYSGSYQPLAPLRILDTRTTLGDLHGRVPGHGSITLTIGGVHGVPANGEAVLLNVAAVNPTSSGYLTVYPYSFRRPTTSELNWASGQTTSQLVTAAINNDKIILYNGGSGSVDFVADQVGYYDWYGLNSFYLPAPPTRLLDTRNGTGTSGTIAKIAPHQTINLDVAEAPGLSHEPTTAIELNITATGASGSGYLTVYPHGSSRPLSSSVNYIGSRSAANLTVMPVGPDGTISIYNGGTTPVDVIADLVGSYFQYPLP
jgi:hypothetical protein